MSLKACISALLISPLAAFQSVNAAPLVDPISASVWLVGHVTGGPGAIGDENWFAPPVTTTTFDPLVFEESAVSTLDGTLTSASVNLSHTFQNARKGAFDFEAQAAIEGYAGGVREATFTFNTLYKFTLNDAAKLVVDFDIHALGSPSLYGLGSYLIAVYPYADDGHELPGTTLLNLWPNGVYYDTHAEATGSVSINLDPGVWGLSFYGQNAIGGTNIGPQSLDVTATYDYRIDRELPEPSLVALLVFSLAGLAFTRRRV